MKLFQTIIIFDVVVAADTEADARATLLKEIRGYPTASPLSTGALGTYNAEPIEPNEFSEREIRHERNVRHKMRDEKPIIGEKLSDADYKRLKGKTNLEAFMLIYSKGPR